MGLYFAAVLLSLFILLGLIFVRSGMREVMRSRRSTQWPTTTGTITRSEIKIDGDSEGTSYMPDIEFSYEIDARAYRSTAIRVGKTYLYERSVANAFNKRYPVGHAITVVYDPDDPAFGILEPGLYKQSFVPVIFGSLIAYAAAALLLMSWLMEP